MTEKQFAAIAANMYAQSAYQQQLIGHLVGLVHALKGIVVQVGESAGMDANDLEKHFADATRKMNFALAEIPFPEFRFSEGDPPSDSSSGSSPQPGN